MDKDGPESVRQWWDSCHGGEHPQRDFFLTGHQGPEVWEHLAVTQRLKPGLAVLNIGVGQGHCTRNLAAKGCRVSALDISPLAIAKVADVIERGYLARDLEEPPERPDGGLPANAFGLILSFLVTQHMEHDGLAAQMRAAVRALLPGGLFAMQYAFPLDPGSYPEDDTPQRCKVGGVVRTPERIASLTRDAGGRVDRDWEHSRYPEYGIGWRIVHVRKADVP